MLARMMVLAGADSFEMIAFNRFRSRSDKRTWYVVFAMINTSFYASMIS
jgi:hypothetical protein